MTAMHRIRSLLHGPEAETGSVDVPAQHFSAAAVLLLSCSIGVSLALCPSVALLAVGAAVFVVLFYLDTWHVILAALFLRALLDAPLFDSLTPPSLGTGPGGALLLAITILGLGYLLVRQVPLGEYPVSMTGLLFLAISLGSMAWGDYGSPAGLYDWLRVFGTWTLYALLVALLGSRERVKLLTKVLIAASALPLGIGLCQIVSGTGITAGGIYRVQGTFLWPNSFARFLVMPMVLATAMLLYAEGRWARVLLSLYLALMGIALVATYTRGSWLALAGAMVAMGLFKKRRLLIACGIGVPLLLSLFPSIGNRLSDLSSSQSTLLSRQLGWQAALAEYRHLPISGRLFGAGWGFLFAGGREGSGLLAQPAHNDVVRLLVETGAFGLFSYAAVLVAAACQTLHNLATSTDGYFQAVSLAFVGILVVYVTVSASDSSVIATPVTGFYFWSYAALMQAIYNLNRRAKSLPSATPS